MPGAGRLIAHLEERGHSVLVRSYPVYSSSSGTAIGKLLDRGQDGVNAVTLDPRSMALWYALDRWLDFRDCAPLLPEHDFVLLNRYTLSNMVYQSLRSTEPEAFRQWVDELEHVQLELSRPDVYVVSYSGYASASQNVLKKEARSYTSSSADVYERDRSLQQRAQRLYVALAAEQLSATIVGCYEGAHLLPAEQIAERVWKAAEHVTCRSHSILSATSSIVVGVK